MTTEGATSVVIPIMVPPVTDEAPQSCLYLTTFMELFMWDQSPAQALCSLLAMCWFWPSGCEAEEKDLFLGSALLSLGRLVKDKLACLAQDVAACLSCQRDAKGDKQPVTRPTGLWEVLTVIADILWIFTLELQSFIQLPQPSVCKYISRNVSLHLFHSQSIHPYYCTLQSTGITTSYPLCIL